VGLITRVAGTTGTAGSSGNDGAATGARLNVPFAVAVTADGGFLIADRSNYVVRKVSAGGVITRVAGTTGVAGSSGDDGPATDAQLNYADVIAVTADGGFLIADLGNQVVRKVSASGVITRVAGTTGTAGSSGDGAAATDARLNNPVGLAVMADGGFLIADSNNHVVRKVSPGGVITRVAGTTGIAGSSGDDGPATDAQLNHPYWLAVTADGAFLIADSNNHVVRKVSAGGVITRVAGTTGMAGSSGDDGLATDAQLNSPNGVAVTADGAFLIADNNNHVVRKVSASGVITRVAGTTGIGGSSGDDGPPTDAQLNFPYGIAVTADGALLIADTGNHVVRKVEPIG
jgi:ketosteroid isomerase-like protein